jgi:hypothetical protein
MAAAHANENILVLPFVSNIDERLASLDRNE